MAKNIAEKLIAHFDEEKFIEIRSLEVKPPYENGLANITCFWRFDTIFGSPYCQSYMLVNFPIKYYFKLSEMMGNVYKADEFFKIIDNYFKEDT